MYVAAPRNSFVIVHNSTFLKEPVTLWNAVVDSTAEYGSHQKEWVCFRITGIHMDKHLWMSEGNGRLPLGLLLQSCLRSRSWELASWASSHYTSSGCSIYLNMILVGYILRMTNSDVRTSQWGKLLWQRREWIVCCLWKIMWLTHLISYSKSIGARVGWNPQQISNV